MLETATWLRRWADDGASGPADHDVRIDPPESAKAPRGFAARIADLVFGSRDRAVSTSTATVPEGVRVYAVGDVHGRADLLERLHHAIAEDATATAAGLECIVVYLGDYVDRGLYSREVLDVLIDKPIAGFESIHIRGNHDEQFLRFLDDIDAGPSWMRYGGDATVYSYGVRVPDDVAPGERMAHIQEQLRESVPARHVEFLDGLMLSRAVGDYLFVHAGVRPRRSLERQDAEDLMWIRDEFLDSDDDFGKVVVHGHTVCPDPEVRDNRIGIDTGAYISGVLTCLVLEGDSRRFLATS